MYMRKKFIPHAQIASKKVELLPMSRTIVKKITCIFRLSSMTDISL